MDILVRRSEYFCSNKVNKRYRMKGRLIAQTLLLLLEGIMVFIFNRINNLSGAIATMMLFFVFI